MRALLQVKFALAKPSGKVSIWRDRCLSGSSVDNDGSAILLIFAEVSCCNNLWMFLLFILLFFPAEDCTLPVVIKTDQYLELTFPQIK